MTNLYQISEKSIGPIKGPGVMIFKTALALLAQLDPVESNQVVKKINDVSNGRSTTINLSGMAEAVFNLIMDGAINSDMRYCADQEKKHRRALKGAAGRWTQNQNTQSSQTQECLSNAQAMHKQCTSKVNKENQNQANPSYSKTNQSDRQIKWAASDTANQQPISNQSATNQKSVSDEELTASSKKLAEMSLRQNTQQNRLPAPKAQSQISRQPEKSPESFTSIADEDAPF